jgi:hypothetical protein
MPSFINSTELKCGSIQEAQHVHGPPVHGHPVHGHPVHGYPVHGYPVHGYPVPGYDVLTDTDHLT